MHMYAYMQNFGNQTHVIHIKLGIGILALTLFYGVTKAFLSLLNYVYSASAFRHQDPYGSIGHGKNPTFISYWL
jgi:hypothetical protein